MHQGWARQQRKYGKAGKEQPWKLKKNKALWRGNSQIGDLSRQRICQCGVAHGDLVDSCGPPLDHNVLCSHKFLINVFGANAAWSHALRNQLSCRSVVLLVESTLYDFYSRALEPDHHVLPVAKDGSLCDAIMNATRVYDKTLQRVQKAADEFVTKELGMEKVYGFMLETLQQYAELQRFTPKRSRGSRPITSKNLLAEFTADNWAQLLKAFPGTEEPNPSLTGGCCNFQHYDSNSPFPQPPKLYLADTSGTADELDGRIMEEWTAHVSKAEKNPKLPQRPPINEAWHNGDHTASSAKHPKSFPVTTQRLQ